MTTSNVYLDIAGDQIDGARDYQEDAFLITYVDDDGGRPKSTALLAMADGVGGAAAGNIASQLVTNTFNRQFTSRFGNEPVPEILRDSLERGNKSLRKSVDETPGLDGMGCTVVTAAITRGQLWWISVGDSHLYIVRDGELIKKNADHSYGAYLDLMEAKGTPVAPDPSLRRNMLMSAMSGDDIAMIDCPDESFELVPGDRVIVSSDGLDTLDSETILAASAASPTPKECVAALLQAVTDAAKPRQDNTT
ncbi:MAG: PP2C family serine/threonine-protein phosphatase, partial [Gammaproteobacteria bacterium]